MRDAGLILMIVLGVLVCLVAVFFDAGLPTSLVGS